MVRRAVQTSLRNPHHLTWNEMFKDRADPGNQRQESTNVCASYLENNDRDGTITKALLVTDVAINGDEHIETATLRFGQEFSI